MTEASPAAPHPAHRLGSVQLMAVTLGLLMLAGWAGVPLSGPGATIAASLALLAFGLPHGTLDLEIIRSRMAGPWTGLLLLVLIYLGLAAAMLGLWRVEPVLALGAFVAIAVVHFAEDWEGTGSSVLGAGIALATLAAPTFLHGPELTAIFQGLTGRPEAATVSSFLAWVAPGAAAVAGLAIMSLWRAQRHEQAIGGLVALSGMVLLPPIVGFSLYFCLFHSPRHFEQSLRDLNWSGFRKWGGVVVPLTLAAGLGAVAVFGIEIRADLPDRVMAASFMTLSILTVPHMLVPLVIARLARTGSGP